jgi:multiple sugar transport system substrate-binding protein
MASAAKDKTAAWTFIEYANSPEGQTIIAQSGRTVPSLIAVAESPAFLDPNAKPANSRVFLDTIPSLRPMPIIPNWGEIEEIASFEIARAFYGRASVVEAMQTAIVQTEEYFAPISR